MGICGGLEVTSTPIVVSTGNMLIPKRAGCVVVMAEPRQAAKHRHPPVAICGNTGVPLNDRFDQPRMGMVMTMYTAGFLHRRGDWLAARAVAIHQVRDFN